MWRGWRIGLGGWAPVEGREEAKEEAKGRKRVDVRTCTYKTMGRTGEDEKKGEKDEVAR